MKTLREYRIESYWAEEALKRKRMAEFKERVLEKIVAGLFYVLGFAVAFELIRQFFEVM